MSQNTIPKTLLRQIYDGEFQPAGDIVPQEPDYVFVCRQLEEEYRFFHEKPDPETQAHFINYHNLVEEAHQMENYAFFEEGFRAGAVLMQELAAKRSASSTISARSFSDKDSA